MDDSLKTYSVRLVLNVEVQAPDKFTAADIAVDNAYNGMYTEAFEMNSLAESMEVVSG